MQDNRKFASLAVMALAAALTLSGCKKTTPPPTPTSSQQPAAQPPASASQPAEQPASSTASAAQSASQPSSAPAETPASPQQSAAVASQPPQPPTAVTLPAGTLIRVRLDQDLGSKISQTGQTFRATVARAVVVNGQTLIPIHARADGVVTDAEPLGKIKGEARLAITLQRVHTPSGSYPVATSSIARVEQGKGKRTAAQGWERFWVELPAAARAR